MSLVLKRKRIDNVIEYITLDKDQVDLIRDYANPSKKLKIELKMLSHVVNVVATDEDKNEILNSGSISLISDAAESTAITLLGKEMKNPRHFFLVQEHNPPHWSVKTDIVTELQKEFKKEEESIQGSIDNIKLKNNNLKRQANGTACRVWNFTPVKSKDLNFDDSLPITLEQFLSCNTVEEKDANFKSGDLFDNDGYRGSGLYYFDGNMLHRTTGEYGYFISAVAWSKVKEHGLEFFGTPSGAEFILLPAECKIESLCAEKEEHDVRVKKGNNGQFAISLFIRDDPDDQVIIDGITYPGTLYQLY